MSGPPSLFDLEHSLPPGLGPNILFSPSMNVSAGR